MLNDTCSFPAANDALHEVVEHLRMAVGANPRQITPVEEMIAASAAFREEFARMDRILDAVIRRGDTEGSLVEGVPFLNAWATANTALFNFARQNLSSTNDALTALI